MFLNFGSKSEVKHAMVAFPPVRDRLALELKPPLRIFGVDEGLRARSQFRAASLSQ